MKMKTLIIILTLSIAYSQVFNTTQNNQEYSTIGAAVQDANEGDYISVSAGTYAESFTIETALTLQGQTGVTIDAMNQSNAISIMGDDITVSGFEIIGSDDVENLDPETLYFIVNLLNKAKIKKVRNEILNLTLPLRV